MARPSCARIAPPEQLELRILPTVKVNFNQNSGLLKITGDNAANRIDIDGVNAGHFEVFIDNTFFDDFTSVDAIKINLKGGDDLLYINAVQLIGSLTVNMGSGADEFDMDNSINLGTGSDGITYIETNTKINLGGDQGDLVDLDGNIGFNGDVSIKGAADVDLDGGGNLHTFEPDLDIFFNKTLNIDFAKSGDVNGDNWTLDFDNVHAVSSVNIKGSNLADSLQLTRSYFFFPLELTLSGGDDSVDIDNGAANKNEFNSGLIANGGSGEDTLLKGLDNLFGSPEDVTGFETIV
ncbi:MAG: hypothetical protein KDA68_07370 [Planctomycetaceae bacterium]|nr:hypothetical protein [Planctomycetaceae bacterium]